MLNTTNIVDIVKANVREGLIDELSQAIDDNVEYRTGVHHNPVTESISHLVKTVENKVKDKTEILIELKDCLELDSLPLKIESFDISNISGNFIVARNVCSSKWCYKKKFI